MRHRWTVALAGMVLVLGACGNTPDGDGDALPKLPFGATGAGGTDGVATAEARDDAAASDAMILPYQSVEYVLADGAEAPARSAPAYRFVVEEVDDARVAELAGAFGVEGEVTDEAEAGYRSVGSGDGQVMVEGRNLGFWSYSRTDGRSVSSDVAVACPDVKGEAVECPSPPTTVPEGMPSAAEAEDRARDILEAAGVDLEGAAVTVEGEPWRTVVFTPRVDGRRVTGLQTSVTFGAHARVEYANGFLGGFGELGDYPLVALDEALERFQSQFGVSQPQVMVDDAAEAREREAADKEAAGSDGSGSAGGGSTGSGGTSAGSAGSTGPSAAPGGEPVATVPGEEPPVTIEPPGFGEGEAPPGTVVDDVPVTTLAPKVVELTGAEVVLELVYPRCPGDPAYLVPAFAFEPEGPTVVAVTDEHLSGLTPPAAGDGDEPAGATEPAEPCPGQPTGRAEPATDPVPPDAPAGKPATEPAPAGDPDRSVESPAPPTTG